MAPSAVNPRRRTAQVSTSPKMLQKSNTFSARTGLRSELCSPLENSQYLLPRSPTTLDVLLNRPENFAATQRAKLADFLKGIDDCMQDASNDAGIDILNNQDVIALPGLISEQVAVPEPMALDEKKPEEPHNHGSDSGIGASIDTPIQDARTIASSLNSVGTSTTIHSAITRSFGADSTFMNHCGPELSKEALKQIQDKIISPILGEPSLKEFHPLVNQVPEHVGSKHITNLRDIEKTFLYGSSRFSVSANSFKKFWEFTIQCLHTTVDFISERDQRKPSDRPYTNSYFLDLVEQIRRYAEIMRRTREKEENGEELDEMDFSPDEQIAVEGGLSNNGKLAELVRKKDGKTLPLIPEGSRPSDEIMSSKRPLSDDEFEDDDDVLRSMARRRKSDKAGDVMHVCSTCRKEFKRPCDLTKHEKTHSRPFKCSEKSCRYYDLGWPTEKERDRHVNDKHSSEPKMYHCMFPPCPYSSKRESNCKQHMEKAHGWQYVRSKSNGRKKAGSAGPESANHTPATPYTPLEATPISAVTPDSNAMQSPWYQTEHSLAFGDSTTSLPYGMSNRRDSVTTAATTYTYSSGFSPDQLQATIDTAPPSENLDFNSPPLFTNHTMDLDFNFNSNVYQQPTPPLTTNDFNFDINYATAGAENSMALPLQQISPHGQGELSLFSPEMCLGDEGFAENMDFGGQDFVLFPPSASTATASTAATNWFPDMEKAAFNSTQFDGFNFDAGNIFPQ